MFHACYQALTLLFLIHFGYSLPFHHKIGNKYNTVPDQIIQGDIAKTPEEALSKRNANIESNTASKWPNGVVPYVISDSIPENFKSVITDSMKMIEYQTDKCIRFVPYNINTDPVPSAWLNILDSGSCFSWIGKAGGEQWLSLTWGCYYQSTVIHELLHTLGFWHEQSRPDRDDYVSINWMNIYYENNGEFEKRGDTINTMEMPYDYYSIMHYKYNTFSIDTSQPSIIPKNSNINMNEMGTRSDLSAFDVLKIWKYYNCKPYYLNF